MKWTHASPGQYRDWPSRACNDVKAAWMAFRPKLLLRPRRTRPLGLARRGRRGAGVLARGVILPQRHQQDGPAALPLHDSVRRAALHLLPQTKEVRPPGPPRAHGRCRCSHLQQHADLLRRPSQHRARLQHQCCESRPPGSIVTRVQPCTPRRSRPGVRHWMASSAPSPPPPSPYPLLSHTIHRNHRANDSITEKKPASKARGFIHQEIGFKRATLPTIT